MDESGRGESGASPSDTGAGMNAVKEETAKLSVASNTCLVVLKLAVGVAIGSVSIISEAVHSGVDLVAAVVAFLSVRKSGEPPDDYHSYGHGKFEDISGLFESILIFVAAGIIMYEAVHKILHGETGFDTGFLSAGMAVMAFSAGLNWVVSMRLMRVAKATGSIALESDAWHLRTDVYTSLGVFAGLVLIRLTGLLWIDPLVAIGVAVLIMKAAYDLTRRSFGDLIDQRLPDRDEERIRAIICEHYSTYVDFHAMRTRRSGPEQFIDLHMTVRKDLSVEAAHDLTDHLEADIRTEFPRANVTIHVEPCAEECEGCARRSVCSVSSLATGKKG
ncbi:MAG TPA: cation diffusion facilitator family transporter [Methanomicrobiales archaeon]|jgi:cation diffusion facilitator family transporter|nr:cation diffusion facilitator family transporter [Methanomicrobiales archaeon]